MGENFPHFLQWEISMLRQSCLYVRGLTPGFSGSGIQNTQSWVDANMSEDTTTLTSFAVDGHASGYVCGFGSVFKNGAFVGDKYSYEIDPNGGWLGNWKNKTANALTGILRQLQIMQDLSANYTHGRSILMVSDGASVQDQTSYAAWGQLVQYLSATKRLDILAHTHSEITAGAYGWDAQPHYFKQFACVVLLLDSTGRTLSAAFVNALSQAIKEGVSFIVLQHGAGQGQANFDAIFNPIGLRTNKSTYIAATEKWKNVSISRYGNHIGWTGIKRLHYDQAVRGSQGYWYSDTGGARPSSLSGQGGTWIPFMCDTVDIPDDVRLNPPFFFRDYCCVEDGAGVSVDYDVAVYPYKPDNWSAGLASGTHTVTWSNGDNQSLQARSKIFCHVVGYGVPGSNGSPPTNPGYTIIDGTYYREGRSYTVYKISKATLAVVERRQFDVHGDGGSGKGSGLVAANAMADYLNSITSDFWVLVTMFDEASYNHLYGRLPAAMYRIGASRRIFGTEFEYRAAYNCFGSPGIGEGNAINEMVKGTVSSDPDATFDVGYDFDANGFPYITGTNLESRARFPLNGAFNNGQAMHMSYSKNLDIVDLGKFFGIKNTATLRDVRFKKLPMFDTKTFTVQVEQPCAAKALVESHDWVHVVNRAGSNYVKYPFGDLKEYLITTSDGDGPNELCTSHLMMNWDMFGGVGSATIYNSAGASHKIYCGAANGNINDPNSLYIRTTEEGKVWHIYERNYKLIEGEASRNSNDWQVWWKWNGVGTQSHNIKVEAGYEYIVFVYDRYGEIELAERHIILPKAEDLPKWPTSILTRDFSNSTTFTINSSLYLNAYCEKSSNNGTENGIMMIIRRPLFESMGDGDRTGWQKVMDNNGSALPRGKDYPFPVVRDYQYMVLGANAEGSYSTYHFNAWNGAFDAVWDSSFEADSGGRMLWSSNLQRLLRGDDDGMTMDCFYGKTQGLPVGVFQIWRRPILCWEPEEIQ